MHVGSHEGLGLGFRVMAEKKWYALRVWGGNQSISVTGASGSTAPGERAPDPGSLGCNQKSPQP